MSDARWVEEDTTPERIDAALRELLHRRHAEDATLVPARVLNLVVIADRAWRGEVINRLEDVGGLQPSRTILCTVEEDRHNLAASATVSDGARPGTAIGVAHETVEIILGPEHLKRIDTIIDPVTVSELPTLVWSPHHRDEAVEVLRATTDVLLIDIDDPVNFDGPGPALQRSLDLQDGGTYIVDLAWLRSLPWRERVAGMFSDPVRAARLDGIRRLQVRHHSVSVGSALLFAGWLTSRLGWEPVSLEVASNGTRSGSLRSREGSAISVELEPAQQLARGIGGITLTGAAGFSLSLDRAPGGMEARELRAGTRPARWRLLGAGRGEGGILGEAMRRALTRDRIYGPAVSAARSLGE
jgi:glucose-6-phosphate dehydrogenase assembly protein OpcA